MNKTKMGKYSHIQVSRTDLVQRYKDAFYQHLPVFNQLMAECERKPDDLTAIGNLRTYLMNVGNTDGTEMVEILTYLTYVSFPVVMNPGLSILQSFGSWWNDVEGVEGWSPGMAIDIPGQGLWEQPDLSGTYAPGGGIDISSVEHSGVSWSDYWPSDPMTGWYTIQAGLFPLPGNPPDKLWR